MKHNLNKTQLPESVSESDPNPNPFLRPNSPSASVRPDLSLVRDIRLHTPPEVRLDLEVLERVGAAGTGVRGSGPSRDVHSRRAGLGCPRPRPRPDGGRSKRRSTRPRRGGRRREERRERRDLRFGEIGYARGEGDGETG